MPKNRFVYIEWEDAVTNNLKWFSTEEALDWDRDTTMVIKECGFILKEDKRHIFLVNRMCHTLFDDGTPDTEVGGLHKIPKTWIRKRKNIKV